MVLSWDFRADPSKEEFVLLDSAGADGGGSTATGGIVL
jgi:hypothetical protein